MKKFLPIIVGVALFVGVGVIAINRAGNQNPAQNIIAANEAKSFSPPQACSVFALDDAKKILGSAATVAEIPAPNASNNDVEVTQCFYEQPTGDTLDSIKNQKQASILVRGAKTSKGEADNVDYFKGSTRPIGVQDVSGYGEAAFWNPEFGQLHILKNSNWYILSVGSLTPSEKKLDDVKALAKILISKL